MLKLDWVSKTKRHAKEQEKRRERRAEKITKKQAPPSFVGKTSFLLKIEAYDLAKSEHSWKQGIGCKTTEELVTLDVVKRDKQTKTKKTNKTKDQIDRNKLSKTRSKKPEKQTKQQVRDTNKQNK